MWQNKTIKHSRSSNKATAIYLLTMIRTHLFPHVSMITKIYQMAKFPDALPRLQTSLLRTGITSFLPHSANYTTICQTCPRNKSHLQMTSTHATL